MRTQPPWPCVWQWCPGLWARSVCVYIGNVGLLFGCHSNAQGVVGFVSK